MKKLLLPLTALALAAGSSQAALFVYEGFNYSNGQNFESPGVANTGTGFTGNVVSSRTVANSGATNATSPGLTYGSLTVSANKLNMDYNGFGTNERISETLSASNQTDLSAAGANYWVSLVFQTPGAFETNRGFSLAPNRGDTFDYWGFRGIGTSASTAVWGVGVGTTFSTGLALSASTTYLAILNVSRDAATSNWTANGWVLSGGSIAANAGALGAAQQTFTGSSGSGNAMQSLYLKALNNGNAIANPWNMDEIRIGNTYLDVVPVPEPTTWALLAVSLTVLMAFRRRRDSSEGHLNLKIQI